jgi:acylphosphatase
MASAHYQVTGRVQGVGFRWFVRVAARRLQLAGWVLNLRDGSVEIAADGRADKLDELRRLITRGPDGANVVEIRDLDPLTEALESPFSMKK